jgi:hypothetical protein
MFLTQQELHQLTDYKRPSDQIRWLTEHGYRFDVGASGRPKVLRSVIENRLESTKKPRTKSPRFDMVNA